MDGGDVRTGLFAYADNYLVDVKFGMIGGSIRGRPNIQGSRVAPARRRSSMAVGDSPEQTPFPAKLWRVRPMQPPVCTENLDSGVLVMQPAYEGMRNNAAGSLDWAKDRRILSQGAMSSQPCCNSSHRILEIGASAAHPMRNGSTIT
jgi:hypothetical protein